MKNNLRLLTLISMMIALSYLFMFLEFPIPALFPPYLKIDPSDIPAVFTGIFIGPIPAIIVELVKNVLHGGQGWALTFLHVEHDLHDLLEISHQRAPIGRISPVLVGA